MLDTVGSTKPIICKLSASEVNKTIVLYRKVHLFDLYCSGWLWYLIECNLMKILGNKKKDLSFFAICTGMLSQQTGIAD